LVNQIVKLYDNKLPIKINNPILPNTKVPNEIIPVKKYINENINNDSALIPRSHMNYWI
jgi:hypothetical protein